ncbi:NAD-dependent protein deacetylase [Flexivirga endophytica]|uniref:protein acetyllysine N-acetyltransferase n=1 Tax=Flexivirga endophytica TaxID=1849103 RepID=A0A916SX41_9MICO|nr:NAD-dependent protein deacetylase [Flexivirga endophytica]GGB17713.1 NAD-dependent protein deacetylase [Flexivirga endophytica]GHB37927.1 NAD-dependent protein deacetylase [Flexivirga endophytica]
MVTTDPAALAELVSGGGVLALTGAGLSTDSGIPDYRGADGKRRFQPMTAQELLATPAARQRYWARSYVGWPRFAAAEPNAGHTAVASLQGAGLVGPIITQNVDGLHQAAGSRGVAELHGSLTHVVCMHCGERYDRSMVDEWLQLANPDFDRSATGALRPDGDVAIAESLIGDFRLAHCVVCGSDLLKPDVVMFGESVPKDLVEQCFAQVEAARVILVLGSSLAVMSGYRFIRRAVRRGIPVAVVTHGWTRATDEEVSVRIDAPLATTLTELADSLAGRRAS